MLFAPMDAARFCLAAWNSHHIQAFLKLVNNVQGKRKTDDTQHEVHVFHQQEEVQDKTKTSDILQQFCFCSKFDLEDKTLTLHI